ncbi:MAG: ACP S-malonyltransferase, partial [Lachnospiraceae bacterium]|nr:ACP S-malonyltransferase [Lachnospiraceae bacterium]
ASGFSLGEVSAETAAGIFDCRTGFRLVIRRGELMQQAAEQHETFMAAVVKLPTDTVKELCSQFEGIYPVNFNCPGQVTVSGLSEHQQEFSQCVKEAGGRAIVLKVKGAFHSPFMKEASEAFAEELKKAEIKKEEITLYSNMTAKPYTEDVVGLLSRQICSPVEWEMIIRGMIAEGIDTFIEIGPGKTLSNMIKKIDDSVKVYAVAEMETLLADLA